MPATRRKTSRTQLQLATAALQPETRYFHSLSCMPMTREEAAAGADSDEEPDIEAWRVCCWRTGRACIEHWVLEAGYLNS